MKEVDPVDRTKVSFNFYDCGTYCDQWAELIFESALY